MTRSIFSITLAVVLGFCGSALAAPSLAKVQDKTHEARELFVRLAAGRERTSIPSSLLAKTNCVVIIPDAYRAAFVVGGSGGWGVASCRIPNGWSAPAYINIGSLSGGFQAGIEKMDIVLLLTRNDAVGSLSHAKFQLDASLGITAGPVGRGIGYGTNFDSPVYAYIHSQGLFLGVNIQGSVLDPNDAYNRFVYGPWSAYDILTSAASPRFTSGRVFAETLERYAPAQ